MTAIDGLVDIAGPAAEAAAENTKKLQDTIKTAKVEIKDQEKKEEFNEMLAKLEKLRQDQATLQQDLKALRTRVRELDTPTNQIFKGVEPNSPASSQTPSTPEVPITKGQVGEVPIEIKTESLKAYSAERDAFKGRVGESTMRKSGLNPNIDGPTQYEGVQNIKG